MEGHITLKHLAARLRLSPSTVSRALKGHPDISSETRKRVLALAQSLDYHPDNIAQSLKTMKSRTLGVIIPEIKHDFFATVLDGIEDVTYQAGYSILVCKSNESHDREVSSTRVLMANRVAGLIVSLSQNTQNTDHFKSLARRQVPIVFFDRVPEFFSSSKVIVDDEEGAFRAVAHLIQTGCRRIAHIGGPQHLSIGRRRFEGYCRALKVHGLPLDMNRVLFGGLYEEDGASAFERLVAEKVDGVFAVNDPVAVGAMLKIKALGLRIPHEVAVVGFSDNAVASIIDPPLTTVAQPAYEMGETAARLLLQEIERTGSERHWVTETLQTRLVVRKSTASSL